jgi:5-methylcytosine-specific restriction endonuclease McrA
MEVNHISPLNGSGYGMGCKHHQDNLETLCMACHSAVTAAQAAARAAARKAAKLAAIAAVAPVEVPVRKRRRKALIAEQVAA